MSSEEYKNKILIIEDDTTLRDNISDYLITEGFLVDTANDGVEGLEKLKSFLPDLVLCDIALPRMNGFDLLQLIRNDEVLNDIPFIFLTAMVGIDDFKTGMKLGAEDYITKPFDFDKLITTIKSRIKKQIEYRLSTERKYRSLIENSLTGVFIIQSEKIVFTNPKFREIFQYETDDIIEINNIIHKDYLREFSRNIIECINDKVRDFSIELKGVKKNGKEIYIQIYAGKSKYENKPAILGNVLDITVKKLAEERIKKSEKRYRELLGMVPAGIIELDKSGNIQYSNCEFLNLTGYRLSDVLRKNILEFIPQNLILKELNNFLENVFKEEIESTPLYFEIIRKNGDIRGIEARWNYLKDAEGNITGIILSLIDITEREKSRLDLLKSEERLHSLMKITSEFIWELDSKGIYTFVNEKVFDILSYTVDEILGKPKLDFISLSEKNTVEKYLEEIYVNKKTYISFKAKYINNINEEIILENRCIPIYDEDGNIIGIRGLSRITTDLETCKENYSLVNDLVKIISENLENSIVLEYDKDGKYRNFSSIEFLGYPSYKYSEDRNFLLEIIHPEDKKIFTTTLKKWLNSNDKHLEQIYRCKDANGDYHTIKDIRERFFINDNDIITLVILKNITIGTIPFINEIIESIPYGVVITSEQGNVKYLNSKAFKITGLTIEELKNKNFSDILFQYEKNQWQEIYEIVKDKGIWESTVKIKIKNNTSINCRVFISKIDDKEKISESFLIILQDLKDFGVMQEEMQKQKEKFYNYIQQESKFISKLSHNIRSPINTIIGYVEILNDKFTDEDSSILLNKILNSALNITSTLDKSLKILQLKTIEDEFSAEEINIIQIIKSSINEFKQKISDKKLLIDIISKNSNIIVSADKALINQLFYLFFENLIEFTKEGNIRILIEVDNTLKRNIIIIRIVVTDLSLCKIINESRNIDLSNYNINELINSEKSILDFILIDKIIKIHNGTINCEFIKQEYSTITIVFPLKQLLINNGLS
ncbi:MAG: PAS domain S-box protein [Ignavibacteria bacterium]|nr:PAS domain S-box protein [Ignavibacteria bacterium]